MGVRKRQDTGHWEVSFGTGANRVRRSFATKKQAEQYLTKLKAEAQEEKYRRQMGRRKNYTFDEALLRWLEGDAKALKSYQRTLDHARQVRPYLENTPLAESVEAANRMKAAMLAKGLKPATINQRLAIVRRVLRLAYDWDWIKEPLGSRIRLLPPNNERHYYLSKEQIHLLADNAREAKPAILQLGYTGLRVSELYGLRPEQKREGGLYLDAKTKSGKPRYIPLANAVKDYPVPPEISRQQLRYRFEMARAAIGMPFLHLHDLRHSAASLLLQIPGVTLAHVRDWLGHSNISVTSRYLHLAREDLKDIAGKL